MLLPLNIVTAGILLITFLTLTSTYTHGTKISSDEQSESERFAGTRTAMPITSKYYFWKYGWLFKRVSRGSRLRLKVETRSLLELATSDFDQDSFYYEFDMARMKMRIALTCTEFDVPCDEGKIVLVSNGHFQEFCGDRVPFNDVSVTRFLQVGFTGYGGPYTGSMKCFVIGLQGHQVTTHPDIFTPVQDDISCADALPAASTYSTEQSCHCGKDYSTSARSNMLANNFMNTGSRVLNGDEVVEDSVGWMGVAHGKSSDVSQYHCAVVLLSDQWVITATSCIRHIPVEHISISLGNHDLTDSSTGISRGVVQAKEFGYNLFTRENDITMLQLDTAVDLEDTAITPICLPNPCLDYEGATGVVAGWGAVDADSQVLSDTLQEVDVPILTNDECNVDFSGNVLDTMICAGDDVAGLCIKDTGGPLWKINSKGYAELVGILSMSKGCNGTDSDLPEIYVRVSEYVTDIITTLTLTADSKVCKAGYW